MKEKTHMSNETHSDVDGYVSMCVHAACISQCY